MHCTKPGIDWLHDRIGGKLQQHLHHRLHKQLLLQMDHSMRGRFWLASIAICSVSAECLQHVPSDCIVCCTLMSLVYLPSSSTCMVLLILLHNLGALTCRLELVSFDHLSCLIYSSRYLDAIHVVIQSRDITKGLVRKATYLNTTLISSTSLIHHDYE
jgi:hypothetical protein